MLGQTTLRLQLFGLVLAAALPLAGLIAFKTVQQLHTDSEQAVQQAERLGRTVAHRTQVKLGRARDLLERVARRDDVKQLDPLHCGHVFASFSDIQAEYTNLITVRSNGTRICSAIRPPPQAPTTVDPALYLSATLASGRFTLGKVTRGIYTGRQILFAAQPLTRDSTGETTGVVALSIDLAALQLVDAEDDLPAGVSVRLTDAAGLVLASNIDPVTRIGSQSDISTPWWPRAQAGSGRLRDAQGVERFYAAAPVAGTDWQAVVDLPADTVLAPARQRALLGAVTVGATLALALAVAMLILRRAARPIEALANLARRATGQPLLPAAQLSRPNLDRAPREVRALGDDLRAMLEARDTARTRDATLNAMFLGISDALVFTDPQRRILGVNPAFTAMFGYEPDDVIGQTPQLMYADPDQYADVARGRFERAMAGEHAYYEVQYRHKDGSTFWAESSGQRIVSPDGELQGMLGMHRDITARRQAAQALAESHGRFQALFWHSPVAIVDSICASGEIVDANPAFERLLGFGRDQVVGKSSLDLAIWVDSEARARAVAALQAQPAAPSTATQLRCNSGAIIDVALSSCSVEIAGVSHLFTLASDITAEMQARRTLEDHREQLESLVASRTLQLESANATLAERAAAIADLYDGAPCGYHSLAPDGTVIAVNATELQMLGYTREEFVAQPFVCRLTPASQALWEERCPHFIRTGSMQDAEFDALRKDGTVLPVLISSVLVRDGQGNPLSTRTTVVDNSERKAREHEIVAMQVELARRADEADAANRAKSAFLANMSHEIRTPLNAITGLTHLLLRDERDELQQDRMGKVLGASRHLLQVINDILDLSKIEAGRMTLERREFTLDELVQRSIELVRPKADEKHLELLVDIDRLPSRLVGDPTRLSQMLINLLANAVKFTDSGWVRLQCEVVHSAGDSLLARFEVQDTGPGIAPALQARLFEAFEQGDMSTTRLYGGTGLGLALIRHFAALMGGTSGLSSELGRGSTFWFTASLERIAGSTPQEVRLDGLNALLVDDLPATRGAIETHLRAFGMQVESCSSGEDALATIDRIARQSRSFDFFVIDESVGGLDGVKMLRQAARVLDAGMPPSLLLTSHDGPELRRASRDAQIGRLLVKPVTARTLQDALASLLQRRGNGAVVAKAGAAEVQLRERYAGALILVAEDNLVNAEVATALLAGAGLCADVAADGLKAVELALRKPYDMILMDMQMPGIDGLEATRRIRRAGATRVPIVAMTANAFGEDQLACLEAGMSDHLAKPVDSEILFATVLRWMGAPSDQAPESGSKPNTPASPDRRLDERLAEIPGYSVAQGLKMTGNRLDLLVRMLRAFVSTYRLGVPDVEQALLEHDFSALRAAAHSVRGACATAGATHVAELAQTLEAALRKDAPTDVEWPEVRRTFARLSDDLSSLTAAIEQLLDS